GTVAAARSGSQHTSRDAEPYIAILTAIGVVYILETLEVHHEKAEHGTIALCAIEFARYALNERPAIQQLGERVGLRKRLEAGVVCPCFLQQLRTLHRSNRGAHYRFRKGDILFRKRRAFVASPEKQHSREVGMYLEWQGGSRPHLGCREPRLPEFPRLAVKRIC